MKYKVLGHTGMRVSELSLGTMTFGDDLGWGASKDVSARILDRYADAGGNFLDSANVYTGGTAERFLGELLKGRRDRFVLATKFTNQTDPEDANSAGNSRKALRTGLEASLERLQTDHIDVYWVHMRDVLTPVEEVMRALDEQVRAGKILSVAVSDWTAWETAQANTTATLSGLTPFSAVQLRYNLLERTPEHELLPMAESYGMPVLAWGPLAEGRLTGKYLDDASARNRRLDDGGGFGFSRSGDDAVVREVVAIADEGGWSPAQVALAWLRHQPGNIIPIIAARTEEQFDANLASLDIDLSPAHLERLDRVSAPALPFPHNVAREHAITLGAYGQQLPDIDDPRAQRVLGATV